MMQNSKLWREYRRQRKPEIREQLITQHLGVVKLIAARIASRLPSHLRLDDLYSAGLLGFLGAVEDYDPDRGVEFGAYAVPRIRGAIFDELRRLDSVPRRVRRKLKDAERVVDGLTARLERAPLDAEVAAALSVTEEAYRQLLRESVTFISIDVAGSADPQHGTPLHTLEDVQTPSPFLSMAVKERRAILARLVDRLPDKERQVLALYYVDQLTMVEVGRVLGVTESRVSQIHSRAVQHLRAALRRERLTESHLAVAAGGGSLVG